MNILAFSSDKSLTNQASDSHKRMVEYSSLVDNYVIVNFSPETEKSVYGNLVILPSGSKNKVASFWSAVWQGVSCSRKMKFDLVTAQDPKFTGLCALIVAKISRVKLLVSVYGSNIHDRYWLKERFANRMSSIMGRFILSNAAAIQADGIETLEDLQKRYGDIVILKPLIPTHIGKFRNLAKLAGDGTFRFLFIARLVGQKNIPMLVDVIEQFANSSPGLRARFTIIGDGPWHSYLLEQVECRKLTPIVKLVRGCASHELAGFYADADALIMTSHYEGFPRVFMEAAAAGLPIVTTEVSGVKNILRDGQSGFVIRQGDTDGFVKALVKLATDRGLYDDFSKAIKADFWQRYSEDSTMEIQKAIFDKFRK